MYVYFSNIYGAHFYDISPGNGAYNAQGNETNLEALMCPTGTTRIARISLTKDGVPCLQIAPKEVDAILSTVIRFRRVKCQDTESPDIRRRSEQHMPHSTRDAKRTGRESASRR